MDPRHLAPDQWALISRAMYDLIVAVGLTLNATLAFLLGHAVIPAVPGSAPSRPLRLVLYPVALLSLVLTLLVLGRALVTSVEVLRSYYPRFLI